MNLESTLQLLQKVLKFEEGLRLTPYLCSLGYPTIGYGMKIGPAGADIKTYQFKISKNVADVWLSDYISDMLKEIEGYPLITQALQHSNDARASVLLSMCFQMGVVGVSKFVNTLAMFISEDWDHAAKGMLNSKWAAQTSSRASRHSEQVRTGNINPSYV